MRKDYLRNLDFEEAAAVAINTVVNGPQAMQFCAECQLGEREADSLFACTILSLLGQHRWCQLLDLPVCSRC